MPAGEAATTPGDESESTADDPIAAEETTLRGAPLLAGRWKPLATLKPAARRQVHRPTMISSATVLHNPWGDTTGVCSYVVDMSTHAPISAAFGTAALLQSATEQCPVRLLNLNGTLKDCSKSRGDTPCSRPFRPSLCPSHCIMMGDSLMADKTHHEPAFNTVYDTR